MAAETIARAGYRVEVFDAMPSVARKFLLAGVGGMNITHNEDYARFTERYGEAAGFLRPILDQLPPTRLREWIHALGIDTFVGSSQRVFPTDMKAAPLLRAWLHRLRSQGVLFHPRHRWLGWPDGKPRSGWSFATADGQVTHQFAAVVLALGGGSWAKLGSDGRWCEPLTAAGVPVIPLQPSNCGFEIGWSEHLQSRFAGTPIKHVGLSLTAPDGSVISRKGELVVSQYGIEGSLVYAISAPLRKQLAAGKADLHLDWLPELTAEDIQARLEQPRKGMSLANLLRKKLHLPAITSSLLKECCPGLETGNTAALARALKAMPLQPRSPRPLDEAISSAGGVSLSAVNTDLMLTALPGVFIAGEMLDWEAPTGGYLLSACFATGQQAGCGLVRWLSDPTLSTPGI